MVSRGLLGNLRFEEIARRPDAFRRERAAHGLEQRFGACQQTRLDECGCDADVRRAFALTVVDRANAVSDLEADVPHEREKAFEIRLPRRRFALRQQNQNIDVGAEIELAAAVAADGDERDLASVLADVRVPRALQERIDESGAIAHQALDGLVVEESLLQA
jgi:hypothetical protein